MKKRTIAALAAVAAVALLAACGGRSGREAVSEELVAPEVSSEDLLVSSLEYLLEEDEAGTQDTDGTEAQKAETQDGPAEERQTSPADDGAADGETSGEEITVYYGSGVSSELEQETVTVETVTPEEIVNALARHNILSLDTKVLSFEQKEEAGRVTLYLDLSRAAGEYLRTMSEEAESVIAASLIDTFLDNYNADAICFTVEGEPLVIFDEEHGEAFESCTPEELLELLQPADRDSADPH